MISHVFPTVQWVQVALFVAPHSRWPHVRIPHWAPAGADETECPRRSWQARLEEQSARKGCSTLKFFCWKMLSKFPGLSSAKLFRPVEKPCRCRKLIQSSISTLSNNHNSSHGFWRLHITWYWMDSWATRQAVRTPEGAVTSLNPLGCCMVLPGQCTESMPVLDLLYPKKLRVLAFLWTSRQLDLSFWTQRKFPPWVLLEETQTTRASSPWGTGSQGPQ